MLRDGAPGCGTCCVGEQQRCVEPVDRETGKVLGGLTVGGVVVAADATRAAEDRLVGPPEPAEHVEDRQANRRSDAVQHPQEGDAEEGDEGEDEVGAALAPQPSQSGDVREGQRCGDDDCCERGLRKIAEQSGAAMSRATTAAAPTRPVTWVREPLWNATAVRDPLALTGNPWKHPAAILAAPTPIISRFPSIPPRSCRRTRTRSRWCR